MASNKNIFCVSNPSKIMDGLWRVITESKIDLSKILLFLPSRRAVRSVEKMIADKMGGAALLPQIVALGEGPDDFDDINDFGVVSEQERIVAMSYLLSGLPSVRNITAALPIARTLITMQDYLENSGIDIADIDWCAAIDDKYARHFKDKAEILSILGHVQNSVFNNRISETKYRNIMARAWCDYVRTMDENNSLVIVCGSTASVPVTRELMSVVARLKNGRIILSGKISGDKSDLELDTNPYNSEYKFLSGIGMEPSDVQEIDVGASHLNFMNDAFGNTIKNQGNYSLSNCHLIECARESEEAATVAEIASRAINENKKVLVITPDVAGNQRLMVEFLRRGIVADFSGGRSGTTTNAGRAILNIMDDWIESDSSLFQELYAESKFNLFDTVAGIIDKFADILNPKFDIEDTESVQVWMQIKKLSDCLATMDIKLGLTDARAFVADALSALRIRGVMNDAADVVVLGTIESRMQTADVVILTGLNEGMFPASGYENPWLPRKFASEIGLPSPNHKVSLMALDFINLSCGADVYWLRSRVSGGMVTQESRFLSRVIVAHGVFDTDVGIDILNVVRARDKVSFNPLNYANPQPPADWSDVYVTEIELLIHNPYAFYVRHILRLNPKNDYWAEPDARDFGNLVHDVLEKANANATTESLIYEMDTRARAILGKNNLMFNFWHRRFTEIVPVAIKMLAKTPNAKTEISGLIKIGGRNVRARADRIWDGGVLDIKTGTAPNKTQLEQGTMPQLPLEAYMLQNGGFALYTTYESSTPIIQFLQLKSGDARIIEYDSDKTSDMIHAALDKTIEMFNIYSVGGAEYKYYRTTEPKYKAWDDFARADERD